MFGRYHQTKEVLKLFVCLFCSALLMMEINQDAQVSFPPPGEAPPLSNPLICTGATEYEQVCAGKAARAVDEFYQGLGFEGGGMELPRVVFMDEVSVGTQDIDWALAIYDRPGNTIRACHYQSGLFQRNGRFEKCDKNALYFSILVHEFAHYYNSMISPGLPPAVDEAIAGFVQYSLMAPDLRIQLLESTSDGFGSYRDVVLSRYLNDPDDFLGSSYLYLRKHPRMLQRWLIHQEPLPKDPLFL